ncbi:MAG TPA: beta-phosphoglucomutase family hydrolase [Dehalococcoidia bacterium]|nr:beta-phosphoglucomutase family hydrolase [Dehalococcoidia bacterium]
MSGNPGRMTAAAHPTLSHDALDAVLFDLDGVVTRTATVHAHAWKRLFDEFLRARAERTSTPFVPFDIDADYRRYVDGRPRYDGVATFLQSRGITLPRGSEDDPPGAETIYALGKRKDAYFVQAVEEHGVQVYDSTVELIHTLRAAKFKTAAVSASKNTMRVLAAVKLTDIFDTIMDGNEAERLNLRGKPAPDTYLEAARRLGVPPARAAVVEDALAGVEAGRAGGFGEVIGVRRAGDPGTLVAHGATVEVTDMSEVSVRPA